MGHLKFSTKGENGTLMKPLDIRQFHNFLTLS